MEEMMNEQQPAPSKRDAHLARLKKNYPDKEFEDDEALFGQIGEDYDRYESENSAMREREQTLSDMFAKDPRSAYFLNDMRQGVDPVIGLVRRFGMEVKDVLDDPDMQAELEEANKEYLERVAKSRELDEEYERNMQETLATTLPQYQQRMGLRDDDIDKICAAWLQIVRDGVLGKLTEETIVLISNALNHDADVANAQAEGEVAGRNAKIGMQLRRREAGDGVRSLAGRNGDGGDQAQKRSIFDLAREAE